MTKLLYSLAALAALAVTAGSASAQYPAPGPYGPVMPASYGQCAQCSGGSGHGGYGVGGHGFGGHGFGGYGMGVGSKLKSGLFGFGFLQGIFTNHGGGGGPQTLPVVDPRSGHAGQLAYPQNPFIRSPRDYFMFEDR